MNKLFSALSNIWNGNLAAGYKPPRLNIPGIERSEAIQVTDVRPAAEKQGKAFSRLVTSDAFGTYRVPDSMIAPSPIRLLQHRAYERFGSNGAPLDIAVQHLVVYRNQQAAFRRGAGGMAVGGAIGATIGVALARQVPANSYGGVTSLVDPKVFDSLAATEHERALYAKDEIAGRAGAHLVYIDTVINGKRVFTRTTTPLKTKDGVNPLTAAVEGSITFHLSQYQQEDS